jgi:hypothetical protein
MEFSCEKCGYETNHSNSYKIHCKSQKHNGKVNKTADIKEYMANYMKEYNSKFKEDVICKVCNKKVKQYTYYSHCNSMVHQLGLRLQDTTTTTEN